MLVLYGARSVVVAPSGASTAEVFGTEDCLKNLHQRRWVDQRSPFIKTAKVGRGRAK